MGNILRDNKAILNRVMKEYTRLADNLDSTLYANFLDWTCNIKFSYKDYEYVFVVDGLRFDIDSSHIKLVEYNGKAIVCLDTNKVFNFGSLRDNGVVSRYEDSSISGMLHLMAGLVWDDLLTKKYVDILDGLYSFYTSKFGEFCDGRSSFIKLFVKHNKEAFISMLSDIISKLSIADSYYHIPKSVYAKDGLVGLCCLNFDKNVIVYPSSGYVDIEKMEIFTKAIRNFMRFNSITDFMKSSSNINYSQLNLYVSFRGKGNKYIADSGSSMIEMVC